MNPSRQAKHKRRPGTATPGASHPDKNSRNKVDTAEIRAIDAHRPGDDPETQTKIESKIMERTSETTVMVVREHPTDKDHLKWTVQTMGGRIIEDRLTYAQAVTRRDELAEDAECE